MVDMVEFSMNEVYEQATEDLENITFDAFNFESMLQEHSLQFLAFKFFVQ